MKANKLAAAASTDASINQLLPPSHGIEMRLSIQNSEQVANLSKEISRLQNLVSFQIPCAVVLDSTLCMS